MTDRKTIIKALDKADVVDLLHAYQSAISNRYECGTCGESFPGSEIDDFLIRDQGEEKWWMICKPCQSKNRHRLLGE